MHGDRHRDGHRELHVSRATWRKTPRLSHGHPEFRRRLGGNTGRGAFRFKRSAAADNRHPETHAPLSKSVEHVPEQLERIIDKALAKNPDDRYQTATDMLIGMRNLKRQLENAAENDRTALFSAADVDAAGAQCGPRTPSGATATTEHSAQYPVSSAE